MKTLRKHIALLLALCIAWQAGEPLAWAAGSMPHASAISTNRFAAEALIFRLDAGFVGTHASVDVREGAKADIPGSRRAPNYSAALLGLLLSLGFISAGAQTTAPIDRTASSVSLDDARRFENLIPRLMQTSPKLRAALLDLKSKQTYRQAMLENDKYLQLVQNDLTHSPRIPLGTSATTPGPFRPTLEDTIARRDLQIEGPIRRIETLQRKGPPISGPFSHRVKELAKLSEETLKTLFLHGGYTFHFDAAAMKKSLEAYRLADIEVENADAKIFEMLDEEAQPLLQAWFDLAIIDVDMRQLVLKRQFAEKKIAEKTYLLKSYNADDRLGVQQSIDTLQASVNAIDAEALTLKDKRDTLAAHLFILKLKGEDADKTLAAKADQYRPLAPQAYPTLAFVQRILLRNGQRVDRNMVAQFHAALEAHLKMTGLPTDPFDPTVSRGILEKGWRVKNAAQSFELSVAESDSAYKPLFETDPTGLLPLAARDEKTLLQLAKVSPHQAELFTEIHHLLEEINDLTLDQSRDRVLRLYGQLGAALPIQMSYQDRQAVDLTRNKLKIQSKKEAIEALNPLLEVTQDINDDAVVAARTALVTAQATLTKTASEAMQWLARIPEKISYQVPAAAGAPAVAPNATTEIELWEDPAYEFTLRTSRLEKNTLEVEKAYQRLIYLMQGRAELRKLLDQKRVEFEKESEPKTAPSSTTPNAQPPIKRDDLALPQGQTGKRTKRAAILGTLFSGLSSAASHPAIHYVFPAWGWVENLALVTISLGLLMMPQLMRYRFNAQKPRWFFYWAVLTVLEGSFFPYGFGGGLVIGAFLAWVGLEVFTGFASRPQRSFVHGQCDALPHESIHFQKGNVLFKKSDVDYLVFIPAHPRRLLVFRESR